MPWSGKRSRLLLETGRAAVVRVYPFMIRLKERETGRAQPVRMRLDARSRTAGIDVARERERTYEETGEVRSEATVLDLMELEHRGPQISGHLMARAALRLGRRSRNLPYRAPHFDNLTRPEGWLAPSLQHRVDTSMCWVDELTCWTAVTATRMEVVRFNLQKLESPEIAGIEHRQGTLPGSEAREYVLTTGGHKCAYCDATDCPQTLMSVVQGTSAQHCKIIQRSDGYGSTSGASSPSYKDAVSAQGIR